MIVSILAAIIALGATTAVMQSEPPKPPSALEACIASAKQTKYEESEDVTGAIEECYENHD